MAHMFVPDPDVRPRDVVRVATAQLEPGCTFVGVKLVVGEGYVVTYTEPDTIDEWENEGGEIHDED